MFGKSLSMVSAYGTEEKLICKLFAFLPILTLSGCMIVTCTSAIQVVQAEKELRAALQRDNIESSPGYLLARYNEPTIPPFLRRNEILIDLPNYKLPSV